MSQHTSAGLARESHAFRLAGQPIVLRPIRPRDAGRLQSYLQALSAESRRNRLFAAVNELPARELARLVGMNGTGELALVALADGDQDGTVIGEAMLVMAERSQRCEIALSVAEDWRRQGLGTLLLRNLECRARQRGARHLFGDVLDTNTAMKCLARREGFAIGIPFTDARLVEIVKDLSQPQRGPPCDEQFTPVPSLAA
jgi:acetyltransferase